ncbi:MAG: hypothetical protein ABIA75_02990 [Candidatus Neomarinimicrobiota bacterium]
MSLTKLVKASIFTALAIGAGYALLLVPNVELVMAIVFAAGLWLGAGWGLLVGMTAEFIFSVMHPLGSGLAVPPLLLAQVVSVGLTGLTGGLLRTWLLYPSGTRFRNIALGLIGLVLTFIYDSLTTLSFPLAAGFDWPQTVAIYLSGLGFTVLHQVSNTIIFSLGIPRIISQYQSQEPAT